MPFPAHAREPQQAQVLYVDPSGTSEGVFTSISAALEAASPGATIRVAAGRYVDRLVIQKPVSIVAYPEGADVEVSWNTQQPYQSTVQCGEGLGPDDTVLLRGLRIRHNSKSVANNYGVYINGGAPRLEGCDISSSSGTGVGIEGAYPTLVDCHVHSCETHGVAVYGALELDAGGGTLQGCEVYGNKLSGVLVRSGAAPRLLGNNIHDNRAFGLSLQDCAGSYEGNTFAGNVKGAVQAVSVFDVDLPKLQAENGLPAGQLVVQ